MIWFGTSFIKFCRSFIKFNKAPGYKDMQLGSVKFEIQKNLMKMLKLIQLNPAVRHV